MKKTEDPTEAPEPIEAAPNIAEEIKQKMESVRANALVKPEGLSDVQKIASSM
jgi:hypothetical protein